MRYIVLSEAIIFSSAATAAFVGWQERAEEGVQVPDPDRAEHLPGQPDEPAAGHSHGLLQPEAVRVREGARLL